MWNYQSDFPSNWNNLNNMGAYGNQLHGTGGIFAAGGVLGMFAGVYMVMVILAIIAIYVLMALSLMKISQKTKRGTPWFAWVPILNQILLLNLANLSGWYLVAIIILAGIPILGWAAIVLFLVYIWMRIAVLCKKPDYLGLLAAIPPFQIILMLYFAYGDDLKLK